MRYFKFLYLTFIYGNFSKRSFRMVTTVCFFNIPQQNSCRIIAKSLIPEVLFFVDYGRLTDIR